MKNLIYLLAASFIISCQSNNYDSTSEIWQSLFNGKDLTGWDLKITGYDLNDNFGNTFQVKDSILLTSYEAYDTFNNRFGHLFYNEKFSHYRIKIDYRFVEEQAAGGPGWAYKNSGVMLHSQSAQSMGKNQDFPISIEAQFLGGKGAGERPTANLCTPGTNVVMGDTLFTNHCISSSSPTFHGEEWITVEFLVLGDSLIRHFVNGDAVFEYNKPQYGGGVVNDFDPSILKEGELIKEGYIALQSESHPIEFRSVELLNLCGCMDKEAKNYKSYFVENDKTKCIY